MSASPRVASAISPTRQNQGRRRSSRVDGFQWALPGKSSEVGFTNGQSSPTRRSHFRVSTIVIIASACAILTFLIIAFAFVANRRSSGSSASFWSSASTDPESTILGGEDSWTSGGSSLGSSTSGAKGWGTASSFLGTAKDTKSWSSSHDFSLDDPSGSGSSSSSSSSLGTGSTWSSLGSSFPRLGASNSDPSGWRATKVGSRWSGQSSTLLEDSDHVSDAGDSDSGIGGSGSSSSTGTWGSKRRSWVSKSDSAGLVDSPDGEEPTDDTGVDSGGSSWRSKRFSGSNELYPDELVQPSKLGVGQKGRSRKSWDNTDDGDDAGTTAFSSGKRMRKGSWGGSFGDSLGKRSRKRSRYSSLDDTTADMGTSRDLELGSSKAGFGKRRTSTEDDSDDGFLGSRRRGRKGISRKFGFNYGSSDADAGVSRQGRSSQKFGDADGDDVGTANVWDSASSRAGRLGKRRSRFGFASSDDVGDDGSGASSGRTRSGSRRRKWTRSYRSAAESDSATDAGSMSAVTQSGRNRRKSSRFGEEGGDKHDSSSRGWRSKATGRVGNDFEEDETGAGSTGGAGWGGKSSSTDSLFSGSRSGSIWRSGSSGSEDAESDTEASSGSLWGPKKSAGWSSAGGSRMGTLGVGLGHAGAAGSSLWGRGRRATGTEIGAADVNQGGMDSGFGSSFSGKAGIGHGTYDGKPEAAAEGGPAAGDGLRSVGTRGGSVGEGLGSASFRLAGREEAGSGMFGEAGSLLSSSTDSGDADFDESGSSMDSRLAAKLAPPSSSTFSLWRWLGFGAKQGPLDSSVGETAISGYAGLGSSAGSSSAGSALSVSATDDDLPSLGGSISGSGLRGGGSSTSSSLDSISGRETGSVGNTQELNGVVPALRGERAFTWNQKGVRGAKGLGGSGDISGSGANGMAVEDDEERP